MKNLLLKETNFMEVLEGCDPLEDISVAKATKGKSFQMSTNRAIITYSGHLPKEQLIPYIIEKCMAKSQGKKVNEIELCRAAHETGKDGLKRTNVVIGMVRCWKITTDKWFDWPGVSRATIRPFTGEHRWRNVVSFLYKEDTENLDLVDWFKNFENGDKYHHTATTFKGHKKIEEELISCSPDQSRVNVCSATWNLLNKNSEHRGLINVELLRFWRKDLYQIVCRRMVDYDKTLEKVGQVTKDGSELNDDDWMSLDREISQSRRPVYVIYNPKGGCGKTDFCRAINRKFPKDTICLQGVDNMRNLGTIIERVKNCGWTGKNCFVNLTRNLEEDEIWGGIESLRDGWLTSQKYMGKNIMFDMVNLVLFMNWLPDFNVMSLDRWVVYHVDNRKSSLEYWDLPRAREERAIRRRAKSENEFS